MKFPFKPSPQRRRDCAEIAQSKKPSAGPLRVLCASAVRKPFWILSLFALCFSGACANRPRPASKVTAPPVSSVKIPLNPFSFETVTLDDKGNIAERKTLTARSFTEDLGNGVKLELVEIPGGKFLMGSPETEAERRSSEGPQHEVAVPTFFMGKFEITQAQWREVAKLPKFRDELSPDPSQFKGDNLPVELVFWDKAMEFCARLSKKTGRTYRLPTEAEWEYAARAGTTTPFTFGPTVTTQIANINGNFPYRAEPKGRIPESTLPVGSLGVANRFGLFDMHGNAWEWCLDEWHENYSGAPNDGRPWGDVEFDATEERENEAEEHQHVLRGGSWARETALSRSAFRYQTKDDTRMSGLGFRVVLVRDKLK
ncbi:MAG: formylglycine-generating enzyme family protein [Blastocatellia bacterium]|nr:formylglycine-generating enzyme family protein [Blastocatellia bacterium]